MDSRFAGWEQLLQCIAGAHRKNGEQSFSYYASFCTWGAPFYGGVQLQSEYKCSVRSVTKQFIPDNESLFWSSDLSARILRLLFLCFYFVSTGNAMIERDYCKSDYRKS